MGASRTATFGRLATVRFTAPVLEMQSVGYVA
jgi:hypothetical protein